MNYRDDIVRLHREEDLTEREIARILEISPSTVHYWIQKKVPTPRTGRPRCTDDSTDNELYTKVVEYPFTTGVDLKREFALECSVDTIRRRLKERGLKNRIPARKPHLTTMHNNKRYRFAALHAGWTIDQWNKVVFSDEKIFRSASRGPLKVYRPLDSDRFDRKYIVTSTHPRGNFTVHVWMAFGGPIRIIHRIEQKTLNTAYYTERILPLIADTLVNENLIYMHDLSPIHTSAGTKAWMNNHNIIYMEDWPPKGPDMNPVENVWAELVRRVHPMTHNNRDQLWENILHAFENLSDDYFNNLVKSMPRRMEMVRTKRGEWTKY